MSVSLKKKDEAFTILKDYKGDNPYILMLKRDVYLKGNVSAINDFQVEYILKNYNFIPKTINKIIKIADWYGEKKQIDWNLDFTPQKIKIITLLGETETTFHCYVQYRQSLPSTGIFLPKKAVLKNFLYEDYNDIDIDFDKYDKITTAKDPLRKLKDHQKSAVKFLVSRKKCILADDPGLGKSTSLAVASIECKYDVTLIICPASVKSTWKRELMWYVDENDISIIEGVNDKTKPELEFMLGYKIGSSNKKRDNLVAEAKGLGKWKNNKFVIVNYDILDEFYKIPFSRSNENILKAYNESPMLQFIKDKNALIIVDEAHKLSNTSSIRYKIIKDLIKRGEPNGLFLSTGTPITNRPINLFNVLSLIGDNITDDWQYYVERYCNGFQIPAKGEKEKYTSYFLKRKKKDSYFKLTELEKEELKKYIKETARLIWITNGASNLEELRDRISHIYLKRVKDDIPGMVKKTIHDIYYDLTYNQKIEYDKLWDEYEAAQHEIDSEKELNKDLIEGAIYRKYISNIMVPHTISLVNDFIEDDEKVIIGCCYDEELYTLQEYFKDKCVVYNGKMTPKQKDKAEHEFMTNDKIKVFIGNINAAGVGLTLVAASKLVFNNMSFVPSDNSQFCDRIHRLSQTKDVDIYYQIFNDTQYEHMWNLVLKKAYIIDQIIKKETEK